MILVRMAALPNDPAPVVWSLFDVPLPATPSQLEPYLETVLERCGAWFGAVGTSVFLSTSRRGDYVLAARTGRSEHIPERATVRVGEGIAGIVIADREPRRLDDPTSDLQFYGRDFQRDGGIGSSLIIPLLAGEGDALGVLNLARADGQSAFSEADLDAARTLGRYVALAVHNARLMAEAGRMAEEQRRAHEALRGVLAAVRSAVAVVTPEGSVGAVNPAATSLVGRDPCLGEDWNGWVSHLSQELSQALVQGATAGRAGNSRTCQVHQSSGPGEPEVLWSVDTQPLIGGGAVIVVQDLSDYAQWQSERNRLARLAEIGQMTAAIAHEIRNPLTGIAAAAQMIRLDQECAEEFSSVIEEEAYRLNALCDEFLAFARPIRLLRTPMQLSEVVTRVSRREEAVFHSLGIRLELEIDPCEPMISMDPSRMDQVLTNLVLNARQVSTEGKHVTVSVGQGTVAVSDQGPGMDADHLGRLFTPFFTTKPQGTGLGLSTVRKLVEAHGARIEARSEPGAGACFTVTFPKEALV